MKSSPLARWPEGCLAVDARWQRESKRIPPPARARSTLFLDDFRQFSALRKPIGPSTSHWRSISPVFFRVKYDLIEVELIRHGLKQPGPLVAPRLGVIYMDGLRGRFSGR